MDTNEIRSEVCNKVRFPNPSSAINRVAQRMENMVESLNFDKKTTTAAETPKEKTEDDVFGELVIKMVSGIPESEGKRMLKV